MKRQHWLLPLIVRSFYMAKMGIVVMLTLLSLLWSWAGCIQSLGSTAKLWACHYFGGGGLLPLTGLPSTGFKSILDAYDFRRMVEADCISSNAAITRKWFQKSERLLLGGIFDSGQRIQTGFWILWLVCVVIQNGVAWAHFLLGMWDYLGNSCFGFDFLKMIQHEKPACQSLPTAYISIMRGRMPRWWWNKAIRRCLYAEWYELLKLEIYNNVWLCNQTIVLFLS